MVSSDIFEVEGEGTRIVENACCLLPLYTLGSLFHDLVVRRLSAAIFDYRSLRIGDFFTLAIVVKGKYY